MKLNPSNEPVVENAQHDPHAPWFLIGVTAPFYLQSTVAGNSLSFSSGRLNSASAEISVIPIKQPIYFENSAVVKSEN